MSWTALLVLAHCLSLNFVSIRIHKSRLLCWVSNHNFLLFQPLKTSDFAMSGNKVDSSATERMDWMHVTEAELKLREEDPLKVSLVKMDEKTCQAKVGLAKKAKQREAEQRERERLAAEAEVRQLAKEERVAEERY